MRPVTRTLHPLGVRITVALALALSTIAAASPAPSRFEFDEPHMGTTVRVVLYADTEERAGRAARAALDVVAALDATLSDYRPDSELSRLPAMAVEGEVTVGPDLLAVLSRAQDLAARTGGAFDITAGPLTSLWRRARRQGELPAPADLEAARAVTGYRLLEVNPARGTVRVRRAGMRLDPGGIAKGYAADRALAAIRLKGVERALVAVGGDLAMGAPPPGRAGWTVALAGLSPESPAPGSPLTLSRCGVSTSGDAEQWVEIGGVRYSHILDPRTGLGLTGRRSVTVVAPDATTSDMLATALSVLGPVEGERLLDGPGTWALVGEAAASGEAWRRLGTEDDQTGDPRGRQSGAEQ